MWMQKVQTNLILAIRVSMSLPPVNVLTAQTALTDWQNTHRRFLPTSQTFGEKDKSNRYGDSTSHQNYWRLVLMFKIECKVWLVYFALWICDKTFPLNPFLQPSLHLQLVCNFVLNWCCQLITFFWVDCFFHLLFLHFKLSWSDQF